MSGPLARTSFPASSNSIPAILLISPTHYIPLDHQQLGSVSAGASYDSEGTRLSAPTCCTAPAFAGMGQRPMGGTFRPISPSISASARISIGDGWKGLTARFDILNAFDEVYEIRDGTGVGVGAPQFGSRRGFFMGLSKNL